MFGYCLDFYPILAACLAWIDFLALTGFGVREKWLSGLVFFTVDKPRYRIGHLPLQRVSPMDKVF